MAKNLNREIVSDIYLTQSQMTLPTANKYALHNFEVKVSSDELTKVRKHIRNGTNLFGRPGRFGHEPFSVVIPAGIYEIRETADYDYTQDEILTPNIPGTLVCECYGTSIYWQGYNFDKFCLFAHEPGTKPDKDYQIMQLPISSNAVIAYKTANSTLYKTVNNHIYLEKDLVLTTLGYNNNTGTNTMWYCHEPNISRADAQIISTPHPINALHLWNARFKPFKTFTIPGGTLWRNLMFMPQISGTTPFFSNTMESVLNEFTNFVEFEGIIQFEDRNEFEFSHIYYSGDHSIYVPSWANHFTNVLGFFNGNPATDAITPGNFLAVYGIPTTGPNQIPERPYSGATVDFRIDSSVEIDEKLLLFLNNFFRCGPNNFN